MNPNHNGSRHLLRRIKRMQGKSLELRSRTSPFIAGFFGSFFLKKNNAGEEI
jgi:hypothetical protein